MMTAPAPAKLAGSSRSAAGTPAKVASGPYMLPRRIGPPRGSLPLDGPVGTGPGALPVSAGPGSGLDLLDGVLGAVGDGQSGLVLQLGRDGPVPHHRGLAVVVHREELRGQPVTAGMAGALLLDHPDPHGKTTASCRGPRTWPPAQVTSAPSARRKLGMRRSHSSRATRSSIRARLEPAQRGIPEPKATCRLWARSRMTSPGCSNASGSRLAPGKFISTLSPAFIGHPRNSMSSVTTRPMVTGAYARNSSSRARGMASGSVASTLASS